MNMNWVRLLGTEYQNCKVVGVAIVRVLGEGRYKVLWTFKDSIGSRKRLALEWFNAWVSECKALEVENELGRKVPNGT